MTIGCSHCSPKIPKRVFGDIRWSRHSEEKVDNGILVNTLISNMAIGL